MKVPSMRGNRPTQVMRLLRGVVITPDGRVVTILTGEWEHHISADIAYAVWQYWRVTGDDGFMLAAGAEILVETARFWASRAQVEHDGHAHIRQVIGPDEYHEMVDDNAYTNAMAIFNLERAADTVAILQAGADRRLATAVRTPRPHGEGASRAGARWRLRW